jgi:hypothetical protein
VSTFLTFSAAHNKREARLELLSRVLESQSRGSVTHAALVTGFRRAIAKRPGRSRPDCTKCKCPVRIAAAQKRAGGFDVHDEDVARLSPLGFDHINMLGRYAFILPDSIARGELRPLRDPQNTNDES